MSLDDRFAAFIVANLDLEIIYVTSDDVTANGSLTAAGDHDPNGKQNKIGSAWRRWHAQGLIEPSGRPSVRSKAPYRKGGRIEVWRVTERGRAWATAADRLL